MYKVTRYNKNWTTLAAICIYVDSVLLLIRNAQKVMQPLIIYARDTEFQLDHYVIQRRHKYEYNPTPIKPLIARILILIALPCVMHTHYAIW